MHQGIDHMAGLLDLFIHLTCSHEDPFPPPPSERHLRVVTEAHMVCKRVVSCFLILTEFLLTIECISESHVLLRSSIQYRIQDFFTGEGAPSPEGTPTYYLTNFFLKVHETGKKIDRRGVCPLDSPVHQ